MATQARRFMVESEVGGMLPSIAVPFRVMNAMTQRGAIAGGAIYGSLVLFALTGCNAPEAKSGGNVVAMTTAGVGGMDDGTSESGSSGTPDPDGSAQPCSNDAECDDENLCNGAEVCSTSSTCAPGTPPEGRPACGDGMVCVGGECVAAVCGNGQIEAGEQCDDGNLATFDGCGDNCNYELFYRIYEVNTLASPAASFCSHPTSAIGDSMTPFILEAHNASTQDELDAGIRNSLFQLLDLDDLSGASDETIEYRMVGAVADPARGTWPSDGSNPLDWWFLANPWDLAPDGGIGIRVPDTSLHQGTFIGGPSMILSEAQDFLDVAVRAHFSTTSPLDVPAAPPEALGDGLMVPQEVVGDGDDEGICGTLTVSYLATQPVTGSLGECLDCPGQSLTYIACEGGVVTEDCNSSLDAMIGGCMLGPTCEGGIAIVLPTQPDVDHGGVPVLTGDPANFNKIPADQTDGNLNGYSLYYRFRARRVHMTGVRE